MTKILSLLALMAALTTVSAPASAAENELFTPNDEQADLNSPEAAPRWDRDRDGNRRPRGGVVCQARNIRGETFRAWGNWRTPIERVRRQALQECRRASYILGRTCRVVSCRRM